MSVLDLQGLTTEREGRGDGHGGGGSNLSVALCESPSCLSVALCGD